MDEMRFTESDERRALRASVATLGAKYGHEYFTGQAVAGGTTERLWAEAGRAGFLGVAVPEEFGGGGGGIGDLAAVCEELAAAGCPLLMMVVSPAICGTVIARFGTPAQRARWLPGFASGELIMAFAITEPEAGSNSHRISTVARRDGEDWLLTGRKTYISGVDEASHVLVVARVQEQRTGKLRPALFVVPTDSDGFEARRIEMSLQSPESQFQLFFDQVRVPADALIGEPGAGLAQLFAGLNPERIMAASHAIGIARYALARGAVYARERSVWGSPIGAHQAIAHPLARCAVEIDLTRLMIMRAAELYDHGRDIEAAEAANMAKYAAGEAGCHVVDAALQTHGGNGLAAEYGLGALLVASRLGRIAPVSREMILNFVAEHSLGLPKSYTSAS